MSSLTCSFTGGGGRAVSCASPDSISLKAQRTRRPRPHQPEDVREDPRAAVRTTTIRLPARGKPILLPLLPPANDNRPPQRPTVPSPPKKPSASAPRTKLRWKPSSRARPPRTPPPTNPPTSPSGRLRPGGKGSCGRRPRRPFGTLARVSRRARWRRSGARAWRCRRGL